MSCFRLETDRLLLRPIERGDLPTLTSLISDWDVAKNLSRVPHPYELAMAEEYFDRQSEGLARGVDFNFGITRKTDSAYMGTCGLHLRDGGRFEIGYWIGKPYWGQGFATEAARKVAGFAFHHLKVEELDAGYFHDNAASGHVLEKIGFEPNGATQLDCLSRGHKVYCHRVVLRRENFAQKKAAA